jgi:hypothetical protein
VGEQKVGNVRSGASNNMNPPVIDTSSLLTMLGILAAVWAVVPATARLTFRLSFSRFDWLVIWAGTLIIHILVFEQVLRSIDLYPVLGPWIWGFDKSALLYLLFLALVVYVYARARATRLSRRSLPLFGQLVTSLLHARKFDELGDLLERHFETVLDIVTHQSVRQNLASWIRPDEPIPSFVIVGRRVVRAPTTRPTWIARVLRRIRIVFSRAVNTNEAAEQQARSIAKTLLSSRALVAYLTRAYPYLCLRVMKGSQALVEDFQDEFFDALLSDEASVYYAELKNNHNLQRGHRLLIPAENRLLSFYLSDIQTAAKLGVSRSLGEAILSRISFDGELVERLNGPLVTYADVGRHRCPIAAGVHFFRIMVLEGLHQRILDHLWLHYVTYIVDRILEHARDVNVEDESAEFPTPFCYLLYQIVDVTTDWIEEAIEVIEEADVVTLDQTEGRHIHIAFEATQALGGVLEGILQSMKVSHRLKGELFGMVLHAYKRVNQTAPLAPLARAIEQGLIRPHGMRAPQGYLASLSQVYACQDHVLRGDTQDFRVAMQAELDSCLAQAADWPI